MVPIDPEMMAQPMEFPNPASNDAEDWAAPTLGKMGI